MLPLAALREEQPTQILDVRPVLAHLGGHVGRNQPLPVSMIEAFGGWFLGRDDSIALIAASVVEAEAASRHLCQIGFDKFVGAAIAPVGMAAGGEKLGAMPIVDAAEVAQRLETGQDWALLDVRSSDEFEAGQIAGARHRYVGDVLAACDGP